MLIKYISIYLSVAAYVVLAESNDITWLADTKITITTVYNSINFNDINTSQHSEDNLKYITVT